MPPLRGVGPYSRPFGPLLGPAAMPAPSPASGSSDSGPAHHGTGGAGRDGAGGLSPRRRRRRARTSTRDAAHVLAELNAIHPFREGNGRTSLAFLALLAARAEHPLRLERLEPDEMLRAAIESFHGRNARLKALIAPLIA